MVEIEHHELELALRHLAVPDPHVGFREQLAQRLGRGLDVLDTVARPKG
jgi:hypothetical protein